MPNLSLPGTAGVALTFDGDVFCSAHAAQVGRVRGEQRPCRPDRPWRAHDGPITRFAADATGDQPPLRCEMMVLSLPGRRRPLHPERRFATFAGDGRIVDALQKRSWAQATGRSSIATACTRLSDPSRTTAPSSEMFTRVGGVRSDGEQVLLDGRVRSRRLDVPSQMTVGC